MSAQIDILSLQEKVADLQTKLLEAHPAMPTLLHQIHSLLQKDPELVTLMSEEEIGTIVNGLKVQTATSISVGIVKAPSEAKKIKDARKASGSAIDLF